MHDKMDHTKNASYMFLHKIKQLNGLMKLPVLVIRMLAQGHGDVCYAYYGLDLFVHDSNYAMESLAKLLWDLEMPPKSSFYKLFD
jgi:hypothetical protein